MLLFFLATMRSITCAAGRWIGKARGMQQIVVRAENSAFGHNTIGIDESRMTVNTGKQMLFFSTLGTGDSRQRPLPLPG